ncbi:MAG: SDR family oxidoreductase [Betaproteobacteria bacterium]|jgi:3-oxoacyl-[acyl-carrier protein] reductase|nr:SDR family oxidoreductase [Betaproteobacteria bacterium]NBP44780.1 SDR family oxidoreductase [Betaproteobacteria bacterium]
MMTLKGRVALVTGGAGGIGSGICQALAEQGATVLVGWHGSEQAALTLIDTLPRAELPHRAVRVPVTQTQALQELALSLAESPGRLDILVNCHGTTRFVPAPDLDALDDDLADLVLATHLRGSFATVRAFHRLLKQSGDGLVVNISSIAAELGVGSNIMYCAAKAGVNSLTRSLALALAPAVRVVALSPGLVETQAAQAFDPAFKAMHVERTPLRRLATPLDLGHSVVALATQLTAVTGVVIPVDGGRVLS